MTNYIEVDNLTKTYNENMPNSLVALRGISFNITKGDCVAIQGESGSGKSTLLHILGCLDNPTSGSYSIEEKKINFASAKQTAALRNKYVGFVLQEFGLLLNETVVENVKIPLLFSDTSLKQMSKMSMNVLKLLGIDNLSHKKVNQLSGGQKQRVAIARAIVNNPSLILADEPTGALDSKTSSEVMDILIDLNKSGKTLVIVTHDDNIAQRCNRIIKIADGQVV